jgi:phage protein D/phage baseplate assembly protein gpV
MAEQQQQASNQAKVEINSKALSEELERELVSWVVDDSVSVPDMFVLTFRDPERTLIERSKAKVGSKVAVSLISEATPGGEKLVSGEITAIEADLDPLGTRTILRGFDESHRLFRGRVTQTYASVTYADVVKQVAQRAGIETGKIDSTSTVHEHVGQGNVSDWQFLRHLAAEVGYEVAVVDGKLEFRNPAQSDKAPKPGNNLATQDPLQLVFGSNLLRLHATVTSAEQVKEVSVRGWDPERKEAVVGQAPVETNGAKNSTTPAELAGKFGGDKRWVGTSVPHRTQAQVDVAAKAAATELAGAYAELDGTARGNPKLRAGTAVSLGRVGEPFDGRYVLTSTRHAYDADNGYTTSFTVSGRRERSLFGLAGGGGAQDGRHLIDGVVTAVVDDVHDPANLARVKVQLPWLGQDYVSHWARTVQPGAGKDRGQVVLPEVGDEVLVAFEQGDLNQPYVLGGLHNGVDKPPLGDGLVDGSTGAVKRRGFVSKLNHRLVFLDDESDKGIALLSGDDKLKLSLNGTTTTIKVTSAGKIEIEGATDVTVKAGANLNVEATSKLTLKGAQVEMTASGPVTVKGAQIKLN